MNSMKRLLLIAALVSATITAAAQPDDVQAYKSVYRIFDFEAVPQTPAPKGYKPFYISHYSRHGARFHTSETAYTNVIEALRKADEAGVLTPYGKTVLQKSEAYFELAKGRYGDLTSLGWKQQKHNAWQLYDLYPEIFRKNPEITACSSLHTRCIMSMSAFCMGLKEKNPKLNIYEDATRVLLDEVRPKDPENVNYRGNKNVPSPYMPYDEFYASRIPESEPVAILSRIISDPKYITDKVDARKLSMELYSFTVGMGCAETDLAIDDLFTEKELADYYEVFNFSFFNSGGISRFGTIPVIQCMVADAEKDINSDGYYVRLRFGHDTIMQGFLAILKADGFIVPEKETELVSSWKTSHTPMAANFQLVFYRSKKSDRILFKPVLNGYEIHLNVIEPVEFPYYDFEDLKAFASALEP